MPEAKELRKIQITCQYVNFPKPGKRLGSIKTSEEEFYGVEPGLICFVSFNKGKSVLSNTPNPPSRREEGEPKEHLKRKV